MRLRETTNEYGTPVVEYRCETCGETFTVCPALDAIEAADVAIEPFS